MVLWGPVAFGAAGREGAAGLAGGCCGELALLGEAGAGEARGLLAAGLG